MPLKVKCTGFAIKCASSEVVSIYKPASAHYLFPWKGEPVARKFFNALVLTQC